MRDIRLSRMGGQEFLLKSALRCGGERIGRPGESWLSWQEAARPTVSGLAR